LELNDDALEKVLSLDTARVAKLKPDTAKIATDQYNKAFKDIASKKEQAFAKAIGLETDLIGDEFIAKVEEFIVTAKTPAGTEITDEVIKKSKVFKAREKELMLQLEEANNKTTAEVERITKENSRKEVLSQVQKAALKLTKAKKPLNISADEAKAEIQLRKFVVADLNGYDFEDLDENGVPKAIYKDGKRLEGAHGHPTTFDQLLEQIHSANGMEFEKVIEKQSPNGDGKTTPPAGQATKPIVLPKDEAEYAKQLSNPELTVVEKGDLMKAWKTKQTAATV